ncbi:unnamed protein product [Bursaphelenchus xylophilus]|uniref:(pine wood nematode) hypothetical protein n=1 Tax=Bursaphelenchus xylophilus TaxID=6326 RepID=A0A1I7SMI5_BURXY|nr:unnamed protein product [Bursaphelenchus xylophilus]CAG9130232.1 unnamed protein product [Bursaphelenchus xylophilus]
MRYGKIYYYDRFGNKVDDQEPIIKSEVRHFAVNSPKLDRAAVSVPFDENRIFDLPKSDSMDGLNMQELISFDRPAFPVDLDDIQFPRTDVDSSYPADPKPVFSPLNDLKSPDDERKQFAKELDHLSENLSKLKSANELAQQFKQSEIEKEFGAEDLCEDCIRSLTRHGQRPHQHGGASRMDGESEIDWQRRLRDHVDKVNDELFHNKGRRELLPMNVLPPFAYRPDEDTEMIRKQKEQYRVELEKDIEKRARAKVDDYERGQNVSNLLNTADAQAYYDDKRNTKQIQESNERYDAEFNRRQAEMRAKREKYEAEQGEWWEDRQKEGELKLERDKQHYLNQLKRNEFLKQNIYNLQEFEDQFRDQKEAQRAMRYPHQADVRAKVEIQSELTRPEAARRARENLESVWDQWEEAHRRNERKKRVLQENGRRGGGGDNRVIFDTAGPSHSQGHHHAAHVKCCRRCRRPLGIVN